MKFWDQTLVQLFLKGGFAMWPLLACSIIAAAIIADRLLYFGRIRLDYPAFLRQLKDLLRSGKRKGALLLCRRHPHPAPRIAEYYLKHLEDDALRDEILKLEGSYALEQVEARLKGLAALTHIAPLLGLLGTVTGLVSAFHRIEILGGQVQPGDLAAGIWEALITTVFGLVIAIPCMGAYHGFENWADQIARRMQFVVSELNEFFGKRSSADVQAEDVELTESELKAAQ